MNHHFFFLRIPSTPEPLAHLEAFEAKQRAKKPDANFPFNFERERRQ